MNGGFCTRCGSLLFKAATCSCVKFETWCPDLEKERGNGPRVWAVGEERAAEVAAERIDQDCDYAIVRAEEAVIYVCRVGGDGTVHGFRVTAAETVTYEVEPLEEDES